MKLVELFEYKIIDLGQTKIIENPNKYQIKNQAVSSGLRGLVIGQDNFIVNAHDMIHQDMAEFLGMDYGDKMIDSYQIDRGDRNTIDVQLIDGIKSDDLPRTVHKALKDLENEGWNINYEFASERDVI